METLIRFWDEVNREDIGIVERVQEGVADTAYTGGRMCYRFEESVHRFQNMVDRPDGRECAAFPLVTPNPACSRCFRPGSVPLAARVAIADLYGVIAPEPVTDLVTSLGLPPYTIEP